MPRIEVAGGLVGQEERGFAHQRTGDRDPLALTAGQRPRPVCGAVLEPDGLHGCGGSLQAVGGGDPPVEESVRDVLQHRAVGSRWNCWKTKPRPCERMPDSSASASPSTDVPATRTVPAVGRSSVPATASRVDFPDPDGPVTATNSPGSTVSDTSRSATTGGCPGVLLGDTLELERVHWATTTAVPGTSPLPETCTSPPAKTPVLTPTSRWCPDGSTTSSP